jgi:hypothetical protein
MIEKYSIHSEFRLYCYTYTVNRKIRTKGRVLLFYFVGSFLALLLTVIIGKAIS